MYTIRSDDCLTCVLPRCPFKSEYCQNFWKSMQNGGSSTMYVLYIGKLQPFFSWLKCMHASLYLILTQQSLYKPFFCSIKWNYKTVTLVFCLTWIELKITLPYVSGWKCMVASISVGLLSLCIHELYIVLAKDFGPVYPSLM